MLFRHFYRDSFLSFVDMLGYPVFNHSQGRTGPPDKLVPALWAGWSAGQVGRHT